MYPDRKAYPIWMLASSSEPLVQSEPGLAPITTGVVLAIEPTVAAFENVCRTNHDVMLRLGPSS